MHKICIQYFKSPVGELILGSLGNELCLADWRYRKKREEIDRRIQTELTGEYVVESSELIETAVSQLNEYFENARQNFDIPLLLAGSDFQKTVWNELMKISYGQTSTYLELTKKLGDEKAIRAVASANGANALAIFIPCHRIVGSHGELVGYAGGLQAKKKLLQLEGVKHYTEQLELF